jgi:tRNA A-37 threonylcarbamoyl transferase component Bud32
MSPLSQEQFRRLESVFHAARELEPSECRRYLDELAEREPETALRLEALLEADRQASTLARPGIPATEDTVREMVGTVTPGDVVGRFRITRVIATGGMGTVFEAEQERPRRKVALKVMRSGLASRGLRQRFELEAEILASLRHPGIAQVYEAGLHEGPAGDVPYFAMELIDGMPLTESARVRDLTVPDRLDLVARICDAAEHAHQKGVVHRDLKPSNILVDQTGQPKILDFGVARCTDADVKTATLATDVGQILGTVAYMSPEQTLGDPRAVDTRADVYALGAILYELMAGRHPLEVSQQPLLEAVRIVREEEPPLLGTLDRRFRGDVETIAATALEKDKERRYPTASAMAADLRRCLADEPIMARPASATYKLRKLIRRHLAAVAAAALILISLVAGLILVAWQKQRADDSATRARSEASEKGAALAKLQRLSDQRRLDLLEAAAGKLWPAYLEMLDALKSWRKEADSLLDRLPLHENTLEALRTRALPRTREELETFHFASLEDQWEHDLLAQLVEGLRRFKGDQGTVANVERRMAWAEEVERRSILEHRDAWARCARAVAGDPRFGGLSLLPQMGLVPLGPDPESGLEEFLHLQVHRGPIPRRDQGDELRISKDTGIVLVLIPGGRTWIGAQKTDPNGRHHDPSAGTDESPVTEVSLAP